MPGRGTSTHDGTAIAFATLRYLLQEVGCLTLFITHFPPLCDTAALAAPAALAASAAPSAPAALAVAYPCAGATANAHMAFMEVGGGDVEPGEVVTAADNNAAGDAAGARAEEGRPVEETETGAPGGGTAEVTFLYELTAGRAPRSYGLNVARLAAVPAPVLKAARLQAEHMRARVRVRASSAPARANSSVAAVAATVAMATAGGAAAAAALRPEELRRFRRLVQSLGALGVGGAAPPADPRPGLLPSLEALQAQLRFSL